ncbi:O-antigen ligase [Bradyrhizobium sp. LB14.3]
MSKIRAVLARVGIYVLCFFDYGVRSYGALIFAVVILISLLCLSRSSWALLKPFVPLWLVTSAYIALSFAHILPPAWTVLYEPEAILRQSLWVFELPLIINLASCYLSLALKGHATREFVIVTVLLLANFCISGILVADWTYSQWSYGPFGYLWAPLSIYLIVAGWGAFIEPRRLIVVLFLIQAIAATLLADGSQTQLAYLTFAAVIVFRKLGRHVATAAMIGLLGLIVSGYAWAWIDPSAVTLRDAAIRALMAKNAFYAAEQTSFVGVGFGTESLQNYYPEIGVQSFNSLDESFVLIGTHNVFFDILMRMGVLGLAAFLWALFSLGYPAGGSERISSYRKLLFAIMVLNLSVNVALQSPFHMGGVAVMLAASFVVSQRPQLRSAPSRSASRRIEAVGLLPV